MVFDSLLTDLSTESVDSFQEFNFQIPFLEHKRLARECEKLNISEEQEMADISLDESHLHGCCLQALKQ